MFRVKVALRQQTTYKENNIFIINTNDRISIRL